MRRNLRDTVLGLTAAVYEIPRIGFYQRALTVVTYEYEHGRWLGIMDQGTMLELRTGPAAG